MVARFEAYKPSFEIDDLIQKSEDEIDRALSLLSVEAGEQDKLVIRRLREMVLKTQ